MLESNSPIIPVFYRVKPAELRWTRGKEGGYAKALNKLERKTTSDPETGEEKLRYDSSTIGNWRNALSQVAGISGLELDECNGDEGELLEKVVEGVFKKVKKPALDVAQYPTGLDDKVMDFENSVSLQLQRSRKARILGIVGLGGVGKTTLAKEIYNRKRSDYSKSCFLYDVRDNADKGFLNLLQTHLLKSLSGWDQRIASVDEGIGILKKHISSPNVLLILDDVDKADQVYELLPDQAVLHPNSLVLITSRYRDVLISSGVEESSIYTLTGLTAQHSLELFCLHSFNRPHPPPAFETLVHKFVEACGGLPLSLKVFGALLKGKNTSYWEDQLIKLRSILPSEIKQRLQISYDALDVTEQSMFLDIACFFIGEDRDMVISIRDNGLCGFQNIQDKCLIELDVENKIKMHDHLRDLGRELAKDSKLPRRLWRWQENDIDDLLQESSVISVRGIRINKSEYNNIDDYNVFGRMRTLQLLDSEGALVEHILTKVQCPNIILLRWKNCPLSSLSSLTSMKNLRILRVGGLHLKTLWEKESQAPSQLRELEISSRLSTIPKSIGKLKHLERIVIGPAPMFAKSTPSFKKLPDEFCSLQSLKTLVLLHCSRLKSLPECFGKLTNLRHIRLNSCYSLEKLPYSFGNLTNLQEIFLSGCYSLERLPESLGNLTNLQRIELSTCYALKRLPDSLGNLTKLQQIKLECRQLEMLPSSFGNLTSLQRIDLNIHETLKCLPSSLGNLTNLQQINLRTCEALKRLPYSLGNLTKLQKICLGKCEALERLPDSLGNLTNLQRIELDGCKNLKRLPDSFCKLIELQYLDLRSCVNLTMSSETLANISTLEYIDLTGCLKIDIIPPQVAHQSSLKKLLLVGTNLKELPNAIGQLSNLEVLEIGSPSLDTLPPSLCDLKNLKELHLRACKVLKWLPASLGDLNNLKVLHLSQCEQLKCLPASLGRLTQLTQLEVSGCPLIRELPFKKEVKGKRETFSDLDNCILPRLQQLKINETGISEVSFSEGVCFTLRFLSFTECNNLVEVGTLPNTIISLSFENCDNLKKIEKLYGFAKLRELRFLSCRELEELPFIETMESLSKLVASGCVKLKSIHGLGQLTNLQTLNVEKCSELKELEGIQNCRLLESLNADNCTKLKSICGLGLLTNLKRLQVRCCSELEELEGIQNCISLERLYAWECVKLKSIPGLGQLTNLRGLYLGGCSELEELEGIQNCILLRSLDASGCVKLKSTRGLGRLTNLRSLYVEGCTELEELEGIETCMGLFSFNVGKCPKLQRSAGLVERFRQRDLLP